MKKPILLLLVALSFAVLHSYGQDAAKAVQSNPNAPVIFFESFVYDYGTLMAGADGECEFVFKNKGKEPLILTNVVSSCGCTVPEWPREPIMPGKTGVIKVSYNTSRVGEINKTITVLSNATTASVRLQIKGNVVNADKAVPLPLNDGAMAPFTK